MTSKSTSSQRVQKSSARFKPDQKSASSIDSKPTYYIIFVRINNQIRGKYGTVLFNNDEVNSVTLIYT